MIGTNELEGTRVILSLVLFFLSVFALVNSSLGILVIPKAVRKRILFRRRSQMFTACLISIGIGAQSMYVTTIPNSDEPSFGTYTSNYSLLFVLVCLFIQCFIHLFGWWREGTVMRVPLQPEAEERAEEAIERGRNIAHLSNNTLMLLTGTIETIIVDDKISSIHRKALKMALENISVVHEQIESMHNEIKMLHPLVLKEIRDDT